MANGLLRASGPSVAACSLYHVAAVSRANVWQAGKTLVPLTDEWRRLLGCA